MHAGDVSDRAVVEALLASVSALGPITALVNNAGLGFFNQLSSTPAESERIWDECLANNLKSVFLMSSAFAPVLSRGGAIVNVSSITAKTGGSRAGFLAYAAAKAGVEGLTFAMARELAPRDITVNVIQPGFVAETDQTKGWDASALVAGIPLGRAGTAADIAGAVAWLLSKDARFVTGQVVPVNGGARFG